MFKASLSCGFLITGLLASATPKVQAQTPAPIAAPSNKKVLIIGTNGTRPDKLEAANAPNIHKLIAESAYNDKAQTGLPSVPPEKPVAWFITGNSCAMWRSLTI